MSGNRDETRCAEMETLLHALADGELDAANTLRCEAHLRGCGRCAAAFADIRATQEALRRDEVRYRTPERLRGHVLAMVEAAVPGWQPEAPAAAEAACLRRPLAVAAAAGSERAPAVPPRRWSW